MMMVDIVGKRGGVTITVVVVVLMVVELVTVMWVARLCSIVGPPTSWLSW